ncbi:hypothetical protein [Streptomyces sp. NPDC057413]|uniref:hypothetical protein n=1 Tax=Streptomyces sp. NPDC057413 TaxID=3346124 RepID=UPI00368DED96
MTSKICESCQQPIGPDEPYGRYEVDGASHGGTTVYLHEYRCRRVPQQVAPAPLYIPWRRPARRRA